MNKRRLDDTELAATQNESESKIFLLARRRVQALANRLLYLQTFAIVFIPSMFALISVLHPNSRIFASASSILLAITDIVFIDRIQRSLLSDSAKLQEEFDCRVFKQRWNYYICGNRPSTLLTTKRSQRFFNKHGDASIVDWYPRIISLAPVDIGQLIAQIVNIEYDFKVRSSYRILLFSVLLLLFAITSFSVWKGFIPLSSTLTAVIIPFFPVVNWCARESYRQYDALKKLIIVKENIKSAWNDLRPTFDVNQVEFITRQVQSANYVRRSSSPVVFEKLYWFRRDSLEGNMIAKAEALVREVNTSLKAHSPAKAY